MAAAIQRRIERGIEENLQNTQHGFRKFRGTREALYNTRRIVTSGESSQTKSLLLLLDWSKAFDTISHPGLFSALQRMSTPFKLISLIQKIYHNANFYVEIDGISSRKYIQKTGLYFRK